MSINSNPKSVKVKDFVVQNIMAQLDKSDATTLRLLDKSLEDFIKNNYFTVCKTNKASYLKNLNLILLSFQEKGLIQIIEQVSEFDNGKIKHFIVLDTVSENLISKNVRASLLRFNMRSIVISKVDFSNDYKDFIESISNAPTNKQVFETYICSMYLKKQVSSAQRGIEFSLTFSEFKKLYKRKYCYYSGVLLNKDDKYNRLTLDRIDSNKGYVSGNVVACSSGVNSFKNELLEYGGYFKECDLTKEEKVKMLKNLTELLENGFDV